MSGPTPGTEDGGTSLRAAITARFGAHSAMAAGWTIDPPQERGEDWIQVAKVQTSLPGQGWKVHVSATAASATDVLARVLPVLEEDGATFKVAASLRKLEALNHGYGGASQVGKFLTVYPVDDDHAVRIAKGLEDATRGLAGPRIPSDRQLLPGSLVHYRYGSFERRWLQTPGGAVVPALESPGGTVVPDVRGRMYHQPDWVSDPFVAAGAAVPPRPVDLLVAGRYLTVAVLNNSARTAVRLALDTETGARCILKHARRFASAGLTGESVALLRREGDFLRRVEGDNHFPQFLGFVEDGDDLFLMIEHCEGGTLERRIEAAAFEGQTVPVEQVAQWGRQLAHVLHSVHQAGYAYGDVKPSNVLVAPEGRLRLIDFETVTPEGQGAAEDDDGLVGSIGFLSPQRNGGAPRSTSDDIYAFGALLFYLLTGADPVEAADTCNLLDRPLHLLNPGVPAALAEVVQRCLHPEVWGRPSSMAEVARALDAVPARPRTGSAPPLDHAALTRWTGAAAATLAARVGHYAGVHGAEWPWRDLHEGAAGIVLTLAEAVSAGALDADVLRVASGHLAASVPLPGGPLAGLYVGEAGVAAALLRAGVVLGDDALVDAAVAKGRLVAAMPHRSPDLFSGTAGRARFHLALAAVTGGADELAAAIEAGERLLAAAEGLSGGKATVPQWPVPVGDGPGTTKTYLGYAHGSAGIADVLLDLLDATGGERFAAVARQTALGLAACALPSLADGTGRDWAVGHDDGSGRAGPFWCHGAAGIGRFLLRVARMGVAPEVQPLALAAVDATARGARWAGPGQCHGLAGNAELVLDAYVETGDRSWLDKAMTLVRLVQPFVDSLDDPERMSDNFSQGRAGIAACLLRVADPVNRPHLMDLRALSRTAGPVAPVTAVARAGRSTELTV